MARSLLTHSEANSVRPREAIILAGGFGTRLSSLLPDRQKCMAPVGGRPFLEVLLCWLRSHGIEHVVLATGYLAESVAEYFGDGSKWGLALDYSVDRPAQGTAGAVLRAVACLSGPAFLVLNGDSFTDVALLDFLDFHARVGSVFSLVAVPLPEPTDYGSVVFDSTGRVTGFAEKEGTLSKWVNAGVYVVSRGALEAIPAVRPASLEKEWVPTLVGRGAWVFAFPHNGYFIDFGTPDRFNRLMDDWPQIAARIQECLR